MANFGRYETVRELHRGVRGSVYSAKLSGAAGAPQYVIKTFQLGSAPGQSATPWRSQIALEAEAFVEQARLQQVLSEAENSNWAPVYAVAAAGDAQRAEQKAKDAGAAGKDFYRVGKLFARSAHDLIAGKVRLSAAQLQQLMTGVVRGLLRVHRHAKRAHGNLKPTNVLLDGDALQAPAVALTDPLPSRELTAAHSEVRDLADAARLMYALVSHRWPGPNEFIELGSEWDRFGRQAAAWRALCRRMLDAVGTDPPLTAEIVLSELERLAPKSRAPLLQFGVPAVVAACLAVVLIMWFKRDPAEVMCNPVWKRGWAEYVAWFEPLALQPDAAAPTDPLQSDGHLKAILESARQVQPFTIASVPGGSAAEQIHQTSNRRNRAMKEFLAVMDEVRESLKSWPVLERLEQHASAMETGSGALGINVSRLGGHLREVIANATPPLAIQEFESNCESDFESVVRGHAKDIRTGLTAALESVQVMDSIAKHEKALDGKIKLLQVAGVDDVMINGLAAMARRSANAELDRLDRSPDECAKALAAKLGSLETLATDMAGLTTRFWKAGSAQTQWAEGQIDVEWFHRGSFYQSLQSSSELSESDARAWLEEIRKPSYARLDPRQDPRERIKTFAARFGDLSARINLMRTHRRFTEMQERRSAFESARAMAESAGEWRHDSRADIEEKTAHVEREFQQFEELVDLQWRTWQVDAKAFADDVRTGRQITSSAALEELWNRERTFHVQNQSDNETLLMKLKPVCDYLKGIDKLAAPVQLPGRGASDEFKKIADQRREACVKALASAFDLKESEKLPYPEDPSFDAIRASASFKDYEKWRADATAFVADVESIETLLNKAFGLDERGPKNTSIADLLNGARTRSTSVYTELQPVFGGVIDRATLLETINELKDPAILKRHVDDRADSCASLAAWRQLGTLESWPATLDDLKFEQKAIAERIKPISETNAHRLADEIEAQAQARWNRCFGQLANSNEITEAAGLLEAFDLETKDILPGSARFNFALVQLRDQIGKLHSDKAKRKDNKAARSAIDEFRKSIGTFENDPAADALLKQLELAVKDADAAKRVEFDQIGPGALKTMTWTVNPSIDDEVVEFTWTAPANQNARFANTRIDGKPQPSAHKITFRLFREDTDYPFYLSTTEVPLGLLINIIDSDDNGWTTFNKLMGQSLLGSGNWQGPRVWSQDADGKRLRTNSHWQALDQVGDLRERQREFPDGGVPASPGYGFPMQHIRPAAAAYVARLLNCRMPTPLEWRHAYDRERGNRSTPQYIQAQRANVADDSFRNQVSHLQKERERLVQGKPIIIPCDPDKGAYSPPNDAANSAAAAIVETGYNDGALWFRPVPEGNEFHDLVGNVAEFVFDDADAMESAPVEKLDSFILQNVNKLHVIGGSAMADLKAAVDWPHAIEKPRAVFPSYSDVGFRLAFSAPGARVTYLAQRVNEVLNQPQSWFIVARR